MEAPSPGVVSDRLRNQQYAVVSVQPISPWLALDFDLPSLNKIKTEDYVMFNAQLAAMLGSGVSLSGALDVLVDQTENRRLRRATQKVAETIREGASFAEALKKHPGVFNNLFTNMVAAGEMAGNLEEVFVRLSSFIEKQAEFQQKISAALFYPVTLLVFSGAVVVFITVSVLPAFVKMFKESGVPLPLPTQILFLVSNFLRAQWVWLSLVALGLYVAFKIIQNTRPGKFVIDRFVLDLPVWGPMARKIEIARFSRTLASLLSSGVPMLQSLETIEKTTESSVFSGVFREARENVSRGSSLSEQLRVSGEFPPMPVKMTAVGEETGALDKMLTKVADFYEMSVDYAIKKMTSMLEPIFLVIVGAIVGFILSSVILPIFSMVSTIRH